MLNFPPLLKVNWCGRAKLSLCIQGINSYSCRPIERYHQVKADRWTRRGYEGVSMKFSRNLLVLSTIVLIGTCVLGQEDRLQRGFKNPPASARPRVWWHWMNGNISQEGIKLDLEWMHRVGIAGFQNFDAALQTPQVVDKRLAYMTPEWKDAFKYAIHLGDQFGMEMAIAGSPGS